MRHRQRTPALLTALALALALAWCLRCPIASAQEVTPTPTPPANDSHSAPDLGGLGNTVADALLHKGQDTLTGWLTQQTSATPAPLTSARQNLLTHLSPAQTTEAPAVIARYHQSRLAADALLGVVISAIGLSALTRLGGVTGKELLWILGPRLLIAVVAANVGREALDWLVQLVNGLCDTLTNGTVTALFAGFASSAGSWSALLLLAAVEVATLALLASRVFTHALFAVLVVVTPLVWVAWVFPAWGGPLRRWGGLLAALLLGQVVQVVALAQGAALAASLMGNSASDPPLAAGATMATLLLATAAPSLVGAGVIAGGWTAGARLLRAGVQLARHTPAGAAAGAAGMAWDVARGPWAHAAEAERPGLPAPRVVDVTWRPVLPAPRVALPAPQ